jgi:uracil-DNA glycosylase family 4
VSEVVRKDPRAKCEECTLYECKCVRSSGFAELGLAIVGEAPGGQEVLEGLPFSARSEGRMNAGYILWECLRQVGITRQQVFVTNVCLCRPPENRTPTQKEIDCCRPRLEHELMEQKARFILMLGNTALRALAHTRMAMMTARTHDWEVLGARGLATYHPAALLRQGDLFTDFANDLEDVAQRVLEGKGRRPPINLQWKTISTMESLAALEKLVGDPVAVDIETSGFSPRVDFVICITLAWGNFSVVIDGDLFQNFQSIAIINRILKNRRQVYHNAKFDVAFLQSMGLTNAEASEDTMLMSYTLDERKGIHGLKDLSKVYLGAYDYEAELKTYLPNRQASYADVPKDILFKYAAQDSHYTLKIHDILKPKLKDGLERVYYEVLIPGSKAVMNIEQNGLVVDTAYMESLKWRYTAEMEELTKQLRHWGGPEYNPNSPIQTERILENLCLVPPGHKGANKEVLESVSHHDFPRTLLAYRKVMKKYSTYVDGLSKHIEGDGRVYPTYLLHGTETGRLSSTKPAIHTIPREKEIRNLFIAPPGWKLIEADYNQHEFRVMAFYSQDEKLTNIFRSGRKIHAEIAVDLYGKDYDHEDYMRAKMVSFGILYGRGAHSLALQLGVPVAESQDYIRRFFDMMPKVKAFLDQVHRDALTKGELVTVFGRRRRFGLVTHENMHEIITQSNNYHCQSTASDLTMLAIVEIQKHIDPSYAKVIGFIHDAVLLEAREERAQEVAELVARVMSEVPARALNTDVPFLSEPNIGDRWGDLKG